MGITSLIGAIIGSGSANKAATTQANAATQAAQLQYQAEQQALQQQQLMYGNALQLASPFYQQGEGALANLSNLLGLPVQGNEVNPSQLATGLGGTPPISGGPGNQPLNPGGNTNQQLGGGYQPRGGQQYNPLAYNGGQFQGNGPISAGTFTSGPGGTAPSVQGTAMAPGGQRYITDPVTGQQTPLRGGQYTAPTAGTTSLQSLVNPSLGATGSLMQPWTQQFQAPTGLTMQNDPGYQARLQLGTQAIQNSAAASGDLLSGNTLASLNQFGQDYASNEYQNVYNRAFNQYATSYNQFQQNQANQYNRLASLAGLGQTTAGQLGYLGANAGQGISNTLLGSAGQIGNSLQNAGAAQASGYAAQGNIWGNTIANLGNLGALAGLGG